MDSSPPPSPTGPPVVSFTTELAGTNDEEVNPQSFLDVIAGRPVSDILDQPSHPRATGAHALEIPPPSLPDVAPSREHSNYDAAGNSNCDAVAGNQDDADKPLSIGDLAGDRGKSEYNDTEYEEDKIPSQGDVRPLDHNSGYEDDYRMSSGPKSYNSDHFGRFRW